MLLTRLGHVFIPFYGRSELTNEGTVDNARYDKTIQTLKTKPWKNLQRSTVQTVSSIITRSSEAVVDLGDELNQRISAFKCMALNHEGLLQQVSIDM